MHRKSNAPSKKVYVSSTFVDLERFRGKVLERLRRSHSVTVAMEDYPAFDERPADKCLNDVARCDIYIGILAKRYGCIPKEANPEGLSITEMEYRGASEAGLSCLMFQLDPKAPWLDEYNDRLTGEGDGGDKIRRFREEVSERHGTRNFREPEELAGLVLEAILSDSQHEVGAATPGYKERPAKARLDELTATLQEARSELAKCERALIYEDNPERRADYRSRVDRLRLLWAELRAEHERLAASFASPLPQAEDTVNELRQMEKSLEAIPREERQPGAGLALSGGGFRATLYHLGSLWRLNELGLLSQLSEISCVSAGSILAGLLGAHWRELSFDTEGVAANFAQVVARPIRHFCSRTIDRPSMLLGLFRLQNAGDALVKRFREYLFGDATLQDLPDSPRITFYATSLQTGAGVRFSKPYLADLHLGLVRTPTVSLAQAVGASCAVPPLLCPVTLRMKPDDWEPTEGADLYPDSRFRSQVVLADGGLYDDMALERIWERYQTVLVSDAGLPFEGSSAFRFEFLRLLVRTFEIVSHRSRSLRKRKLIEDFRCNRMQGAYWGIGGSMTDYGLGDLGPMTSDSDLTRSLSRLRTRFARFSHEEQGRLINWGYACADAALRRFLLPAAPSPPGWPMPEHPL